MGVLGTRGGVLLLVLAIGLSLRARRRRRAAVRETSPVGPVAAALVTLLLLSGCSVTGDSVDREAYRAARSALAAAFSADPDAAAPVFAEPVSGPIADPESAVPPVLEAAGLPSDPSTITAARFLTRQLFDPAFLCGQGSSASIRELLVAP